MRPRSGQAQARRCRCPMRQPGKARLPSLRYRLQFRQKSARRTLRRRSMAERRDLAVPSRWPVWPRRRMHRMPASCVVRCWRFSWRLSPSVFSSSGFVVDRPRRALRGQLPKSRRARPRLQSQSHLRRAKHLSVLPVPLRPKGNRPENPRLMSSRLVSRQLLMSRQLLVSPRLSSLQLASRLHRSQPSRSPSQHNPPRSRRLPRAQADRPSNRVPARNRPQAFRRRSLRFLLKIQLRSSKPLNSGSRPGLTPGRRSRWKPTSSATDRASAPPD